MLRGFHLADFLTLANAACGVAAVFFCMLYMGRQARAIFSRPRPYTGGISLRLARWPRRAMAAQAFGARARVGFAGGHYLVRVAPASLGFAAGLRGGWDWMALIYFVCCGVSRLARYNVTAESLSEGSDKVAYFEGTPIPTTMLLTGVLAFVAWQSRLGENLYRGAWTVGPWDLHPLSLLFVLSGSLMISKTLHIPKV